MNIPHCNLCNTKLLDDNNKPLTQIALDGLTVYEANKGAGQLKDAHFCSSEHLKEWIDEQFARPAVIETLGNKDAKIVGMNGRAL